MPFAYVDLDLLEQNIRQILKRAQGKRIRLASKSLRSTAILQRILASDSSFQGIMCYSASEALYLAAKGFTDLLIGYPTWNEQDITAIAQATRDGASITLMIDSIEHVERIEAQAQRQGVRLPVCLEIDMSLNIPGLHFGVWRSALHTPEQTRPLIERILASHSVRLDGLMGYEAQIAGVGDNIPGQKVKNMLVRMLKRRSRQDVAERRTAFAALVKTYGETLRFINGGGTGSIATTAQEDDVQRLPLAQASTHLCCSIIIKTFTISLPQALLLRSYAILNQRSIPAPVVVISRRVPLDVRNCHILIFPLAEPSILLKVPARCRRPLDIRVLFICN